MTLYQNARVYTGDGFVTSFGVEAGRFVPPEEASADRVVDLGGGFVLPGLIDSHMHLLNYGQALSVAPLYAHTASLAEMLDCLREASTGRGGWILGRGWNHDYFTDARRMPNRWDLDRVSTTHPVCAVRACGHALSVNSRALEMLGILEQVPQVEGGEVVTENGVPNGIFLDNAMGMVYELIPPPNKEEVKRMLQTAAAALNAYGITGCHSDDYCVFQGLEPETIHQAYRELEASGELTVRVYEQANFDDVRKLRSFVESGYNTGVGSDFFKIGPLKLLGDGSLGARTALLSKPYADDPEKLGLGIFTQNEFDELIGYAHAQGMQVAVHCIGDACLDMVLASFEKALAEHPRTDHRHGIVHCQITRPDQLQKIAEMGLHVYAQSIFLDYDIHIVEARVGKELAESSYSWKTLKRLGATVSNGSDCPVELPNALGGIQCAVTRCDLSGKGPYLPNEAFSVTEAIQSFTVGSAYASFEEDQKGKIAPGYLADFTLLGADPFAVEPGEIKKIPVLGTWVGGKPVFQK
ncbi:MAG: amidohydrolase [Clostridia bacterium]|nr:amidohydrolase [Clostridia bacterium]